MDDDDLPLIPCPHCREEIVEDSQRCPHCGMYISEEDSPPRRWSPFMAVMMGLALLMAAFWAFGW